MWHRWIYDLNCLIKKDSTSTRWTFGLSEEFDNIDFTYVAFIIGLSFLAGIPRFLAFRHGFFGFAADISYKPMAFFLAIPVRVIIMAGLAAVFLWIGSYFNRRPREIGVMAKLSLRIVAVAPLLQLLSFFPENLFQVVSLLVYGFFVVKAAVNVLDMPLRNALAFFGAVYFTFCMIQIQSQFRPVQASPFDENYKGGLVPPPPSGQ